MLWLISEFLYNIAKRTVSTSNFFTLCVVIILSESAIENHFDTLICVQLYTEHRAQVGGGGGLGRNSLPNLLHFFLF